MTINNYLGVLYDVIYYNAIYFNKESVRSYLKVYAEKEDDVFVFYDEFRKGKGAIDPPESLYPFFYYNLNRPCALSLHFFKYFDFFTGTYESYFNLFQDVGKFKRYMIFYYLEQYRDKINIEAVINGDTIEICKSLLEMRYHGERADTFINLFHNFEHLANDLIHYLNRVLHKIKFFHSRKKGLYQTAIDKFIHNDHIHLYKKVYDIKDGIKFAKQVYSVCFMQRYVVICRNRKDESQCNFILGNDGFLPIRTNANYNYLTYNAVSKIFANETMDDIVKALTREELTITQLSMKLNVSRPTTDRFLGMLYDDMAIQLARVKGNEKYYKLNPDYFAAAKKVLIDKIDNILYEYKINHITNKKKEV